MRKLSCEQVEKICEALLLQEGRKRLFACDTLTPADAAQPFPSAERLMISGFHFPVPESLPLPTYKRMPGHVPELTSSSLKRTFFEFREYGKTQTMCGSERPQLQREYLLQLGWLDRVGWARAPGAQLISYSASSRVQLS